jgi:predicted transcriptional regulator
VLAEVVAPEQYLLRRIIRQWQALIIEMGGEVGQAELGKPVENPYIYGNPVRGDLFVGREDILSRLEELWVGAGQKPSVVLYGHRRMGKSSILDNLGARFGVQTIIVDFNMQREGMVTNTGELLYNLALALYDALRPDINVRAESSSRLKPAKQDASASLSFQPGALAQGDWAEFPEPDETQFTAHNPYTAFNRFLKQLDRVRGENRFIVTVDEFELIEKLIREGKLAQGLLDYWRSLIQTYPWFVMALAGLHTLQEMTEDYWHPLFSSVIAMPISFLNPGAARRLITQPNPDFPIDYDADAIDTIISLTNGQPYLVQLICHGLVTRFNRQTFEEGVERARRFSLSDVEAVINTAEFYRDGNAYFIGVWIQAETSKPSGQTMVLSALAKSENGMTIEELARQAGLLAEEVNSALETLIKHDVVRKDNEHWRFTVELMRRWVAQRKNG